MEVYNVEISDKYIFYTKDKAEDAAIARMPKEAVLLIKRQDGSTVNLYETAVPVQSTPAEAQAPVILTPELLDEAARRTNADRIAQANLPVSFVPGEGKDLEKEANLVWFRMGVQEGSVLDDGTVSLSLQTGSFGWANYQKRDYTYVFYLDHDPETANEIITEQSNPGLQVTVTNKGNRTVYIDLGSSFFIRMGQTQCYYVPSSTSVSSSTSSGAGLNIGAVTGALGIGGVVGTIASGLSVGGGSTNGSTTVTYAQRIITIPPRSTVNLEAQWLFGSTEREVMPGLSYGKWRGYQGRCHSVFCFPKDAPEGPLMTGQHLVYSEASSPFRVSALVAYSFSEDGNASRTLSAHLYLKDLVGRNCNYLKGKLGDSVQCEGTPISFGGGLDDKKGTTGFPRP